MFCKSCGTQLSDDALFCHNCGVDTTPENTASSANFNNMNFNNQGSGFTSPAAPATPTTPILVFGILSLVFCETMIFSFLGIIFGAIAQSKAKAFMAAEGALYGKAKVGRILGKIGMILSIVMTALVAFIFLMIILAFVAGAGDAFMEGFLEGLQFYY